MEDMASKHRMMISNKRLEIPERDKHFEFASLLKIRDGINSQIKIVEKNTKELIDIYCDTMPLLETRREVMIFVSKLRTFCYLFVTSKPYETFSLIIILLNTIFMIISDPNDDKSIINQSELLFFVVYLCELLLKLAGMGLFTKKIGFFRNPWNILDFFIVIASFLDMVLKDLNFNLSALRSLRVLRPLKTVSSVKSLKNIILTIFSSLPFLKDILIILLFFLILFGITGMHLFQGVLRNVCYDPMTGSNPVTNVLMQTSYCDSDSVCPGISICVETYSNPNYAQTSFDNVFMGILMVFQVSTTENWSWMLYSLFHAFDSIMPVITLVYFVTIIVLLNFVVANLMLAVIVVKFNEAHESNSKKKAETFHSEFCNCHSGFNYAQMKVCGYFLSLSNLNLNACSKINNHRYIYDFKESLNKPYDLEVDPEFRFQIVETLHKKKRPEEDMATFQINALFSLKKKKSGKTSNSLLNVKKRRTKKREERESELLLRQNSFGINKRLSNFKSHYFKDSAENNQLLMDKKPEPEKPLAQQVLQKEMEGGNNHNPISSRASSQSHSFDEKQFKRPPKEEFMVRTNFVKKESIKLRPNLKNKVKPVFQEKRSGSLISENENHFDFDFEANINTGVKKASTKEIDHSLNSKHLPMIKRRNANLTSDIKQVGQNTRNLFKPVTINVAQNQTELEKIDLKKEQMKAEKEFNSFMNSNLNLLKLDMDYCKNTHQELYRDVKETIVSSEYLIRRAKEEKQKRDEILKSKVTMVYNPKYIQKDSKGDYAESENEDSDTFQYSKTNIRAGSASQNSLRFGANGKLISKKEFSFHTRTKIRLLLHEQMSKLFTFYFYIMKSSCKVVDTHERPVKNNSTTLVPLETEAAKKMQPSICKHKSKNFSAIKSFFSEQFVFDSPSKCDFEISFVSLLHEGLINDSIQKLKIIHTNWSGFEISVNPNSKSRKVHQIFEKLNFEVYEMWLPGMIGKFNILRRMIRQMFAINYVEFFFIGLVLLNTVILSMNGLVDNQDFLDTTNTVLTIIFTIEIILKFIGLGLFEFYKDIFNIFDLFIVTLSLVEIALQTNSQVLSAIKVIRVLRTVRVLRASRILRNLKFMRTLIRIFQITFEQFIYTTLLLLLFLSIFSLIGNQFYSGKWTFLEKWEPLAQNFETFWDSFLVMVDIMSLVNWNDTATLLMRSGFPYVISVSYLIIWIFLGNYILLNLFIAVLLDGFSSAVTLNQVEDLNNEFEGIELGATNQFEEEKKKIRENDQNAKLLNEMFAHPSKSQNDIERQKEIIKNTIIYNYDHKVNDLKENSIDSNEKLYATLKEDELDDSLITSDNDISKYLIRNPKKQENATLVFDQIFCEESLFLFAKDGFIRTCFIKMVTSSMFENFILFVIFVSSSHLVVTTYSDSTWTGTTLQSILDIVDLVVNFIFIFEMSSKVIAYGFFWCEGSYLRDNWSILDFIIVCTSILDMLLKNSGNTFLGVLKIIRTLRPLRVLSHNQNLRIVVQCLIQSFTGILNVAVVVIMVWLMFAILGMNLMSGKMGFCSFTDNRSYYYINTTLCVDFGGEWQTRGANFDNIFTGLATMFAFSNAENWNTYTFYMMDGDDSSVGPSSHASYFFSVYCVVFIFVSTFFLTKLFIGVIYSEFDNEQKRISKQNFKIVSDEQIKWIQMQKMIKLATPNYVEIVVPQNRVRLFIYKIVTSQAFEWIIMSMIFGNLISLAMVYSTMNPVYSQFLTILGLIFTGVFILEMCLKVVALGFMAYIESNWNKFDFVIVMFSILDILLTNAINIQGVSIYPLIGRIMRILRVSRIFKMLKSKKLEGINKIIKTLFYSIPAILNVTLVLMLVYFIYAVLGVFLFKSTDAQFNNFGSAVLYLFISSTGENWPEFMYTDRNNSPIIGSIFWLTFIFLTTFTLMNLFMSVIIDQFSNFYFNSENPINSFEEIVEEFRVCWLLFASKYKGEKIKSRDILNFFICLKSPLGFHIPLKKEKSNVYGDDFSLNYFHTTLKFDLNFVRRKIAEMQLIEDKQGFISFGQVLHASLKNAFGKNCYKNSNPDTCKEIKKIEMKTVAKIFNKKIEDYDITYDKEDKKASLNSRISNPFNNVLFSQMIFQIWYNHTKSLVGNEDISSEDLEDLLNKNPDRQFEKQILMNMKKIIQKNMEGTFKKDNKEI